MVATLAENIASAPLGPAVALAVLMALTALQGFGKGTGNSAERLAVSIFLGFGLKNGIIDDHDSDVSDVSGQVLTPTWLLPQLLTDVITWMFPTSFGCWFDDV